MQVAAAHAHGRHFQQHVFGPDLGLWDIAQLDGVLFVFVVDDSRLSHAFPFAAEALPTGTSP